MVLEEVCELVIKQDGSIEFGGDVEFHDTLLLIRGADRRIASVVDECVFRGRWLCLFVSRAQAIRKLVGGHLHEIGGSGGGRREFLAVGVVKGNF